MSTEVVESNEADFTRHVAEEVRALMGRRDINKTQLARRLGVSDVWVGRRLHGRTPFDVNDLQRIAVVLGVSVVDLLPKEAGRVTERYAPGERVIATAGSLESVNKRPTPPIRRPSLRRRPPSAGSSRPVTPVAV